MTSEAPVRYALAETAPAPTVDVLTYLTRTLTDDEPTTGTDDTATEEAATVTSDAADEGTDEATASDAAATDTPATADSAPIAA
jgi:hypothetical protein